MKSTLNKILSVKYNIVNYRYNVVLQICMGYSSCLIKTEQLFISPLPQPLKITILLFTSVNLTISDTSYTWDHTVFVLL